MTNITKYSGNDSLSLLRISEEFFKSGLFPNIKSPAAAFAVIHYGYELNVTPMVSLQTMSIIKGKMSMGAGVMLSLAKRSGVKINILKETDTECEIEFSRDGDKYTCSFTIEDAKKAELVKKDGAWEKYPKDLLFHRAVTRGLRRVCPELILGLYTPEEITSIPDEPRQIEKPIIKPVLESNPAFLTKATPETVEAEATDDAQSVGGKGELMSGDLAKALHTAFVRVGLMPFRDVFKQYCVSMEWMDDPKASFKTMRADTARTVLDNIEYNMVTMYSTPGFHPALRKVFAGLGLEDKRSSLIKMSCHVEDIDMLPKKISDMTAEFAVDAFNLFLTVLKNQHHNNIVSKNEGDGISVEKTIDTLDKLGMEPKVIETAEIDNSAPKDKFF